MLYRLGPIACDASKEAIDLLAVFTTSSSVLEEDEPLLYAERRIMPSSIREMHR
jgi:hypothetical protein